MQLIAMAMPKGDKSKQKSKNRRTSHSNDDSAEITSAITNQSQDNRSTPREPGYHHQTIDRQFLTTVDTSLHHPTVRAAHNSSSLPMPVLQVYSDDSPAILPIEQHDSFREDVLSESLLFEQQDNESVDSAFSEFGNEGNVNRLSEEIFEYSSVVVSNEDIASVEKHERGDESSSSHSAVSCRELLKIKSRSIYIKSGPEEVDENMNLTYIGMNNSTHLQQQSLDNWYKITPAVDKMSFSPTERPNPDTESKDSSEGFTSCTDHSLMEQAFNSDTNSFKISETEHGSQICCLSHKKNISEEDRDSAKQDYSTAQSSAALIELKRQASAPVSWCESDLNFWSVVEPPVWTSLALRESTIHSPEITHVLPQSASGQLALGNLSYQMGMLPPDAGNECPVRFSEIECDPIDEGSVPDNHVFQMCGSEYEENALSKCFDGYDHVDNYINNDEDQEYFVTSKNNSPVALDDLDYITRMLPLTHIVSDMVLNQMTDEEVTTLTLDPEDEEILPYDALHAYDDLRPSNPVACILEHGGNEHFLPILLHVPQDTSDVE